ncbi:MAG: cytochrome c [Anaeromyxobacteraceae bacterium]
MTMPKKHTTMMWLGASALGVALAACGSGAVSGSGVTGVALNNGPVSGTVSLNDSSAQVQSRQVATRPDGSFSIDVTGLTPPYMLKVDGTAPGGTAQLYAGTSQLYAVTDGAANLDINPITDMAYTTAIDGSDPEVVFTTADAGMKKSAAVKAANLLDKLEEVLAPLFQLYGITDPEVDKEAVRALLADVTVTNVKGTVTVANAATGGVIFVGPLSDLSSGTFDAANMPAGPGTTPPPAPSTCSSFTYSAWGSCQPDGTQSRTVASASPAGCTGGSPVTTQGCAYVPPVSTCTGFTYSTWSACQTDNTQTRTVISTSPTGCTGGAPVTTQSCTYVPPVTTCSSFTYSAWNTCQSNNTQTRTVTASSPTGCTGGTPVTTQACTYVPPVTTCSAFTYSAWNSCQSNNTQTRTVTSSSPTGCTGGTPVTSQSCTYVAPIDGAALYTQYCAGCHGTSKKGSTATAIQGAIDTNRGGMGFLSFLTPAQVAAISAAP